MAGVRWPLGRSDIAFKLVLYVLLAANTAYFALGDSPSKAIDAAAWFALLLLFEIETRHAHRLTQPWLVRALGMARLLAAAGVIAATGGYVFEDNALDAANSVLWIAIVIMLEAQVRWPAGALRHRAAFTLSAITLYGGLGVLVILWAAAGMWFDAYDALLWIVAFVAIELAVTRAEPALAARA
jgi:hypothetical protein